MSTIKSKMPYLERDVSWMHFNRRVMQEACRENVPLLERLSFLGIYSNNLDEFFRVRIASQNRIIEWAGKQGEKEVKLARSVVRQISRLNSVYQKEYEKAIGDLYQQLQKEDIYLITDEQVDAQQLEFIRSYYDEKIDGLIVPIAFSSVKHLDYDSDQSIYHAVRASRTNAAGNTVYEYSYFELPVQVCGRFVRLPDKDGKSYIMYLDDVIRCSLPKIYAGSGCRSFESYAFKFTRDAEMEIEDGQRNGILQKISKGLKNRKKGEPLRVVYDGNMPTILLRRLLRKLELGKNDTLEEGGRYHNHKDLMKFPLCGRKELGYAPMTPLNVPWAQEEGGILNAVKRQDRFIHVPYHGFSAFLGLLHEAALSPEVKSIKIALYRLAKDSRVISTLIGAARNGKKVTVVIELLARFDEESNMVWAQKLQDAGVKVIFGVEGLKVHSKIVHIGMKKGGNIACISTGNFHEGNAKSYTDCIMMTSLKRVVSEVSLMFDFIEKPYFTVKFKELLVSPNDMKRKFLSLIDEEIRNHKAGRPAYIKIKINHITDRVMVAKLYEAARAGVEVDLLVRGNCSLVTAALPKSCRIRVCGIIDRYLEHSRIFVFACGGEEKVFIGSADWMPRNLDNRIEVVAPVYDPTLKQEMKRIVEYGMRDTRQGRLVDGTGNNEPWTCDNPLETGSQQALYEYYAAQCAKND